MGGTFGGVLRDLRVSAHLSLAALGRRVHYSDSHLCELELGKRQPTLRLAASLDAALNAGGRLMRLAGGGGGGDFGARSHKFIPGVIGHAAADRLAGDMQADTGGLLPHWTRPVHHPGGVCTLHVWPHGTAMWHLVEDQRWPTLADFAAWRYLSYDRDTAWATQQLAGLAPVGPAADYVLSAYWLHDPGWGGAQLDTALRVMCMPRMLREQGADAVERRLLEAGFGDPGLDAFGVDGVSIGYASWAGVTYHPLDDDRALPETDLVGCELAVQSVWAYAAWLGAQVEAGQAPQTGPYGWKWLLGVRSKLANPRPQETTPHRAMREAILRTSELDEMLARLIDALRAVAA